MLFRIFTLHPDIFSSFLDNALVARGRAQEIIEVELMNWREMFGVGGYKQVDDKPFGGGHGMVLQPEPIYQALKSVGGVSSFFSELENPVVHSRVAPNNTRFYTKSNQIANFSTATISLTPRGHTINQQTFEWLAKFQELNILCGRYEGFDSRVSEMVDLELSLGDFVLNGGEVAAMCLVEGVSRIIPGFVTKTDTVLHDSFSSNLNQYKEQEEFVIGKNNIQNRVLGNKEINVKNIFDDELWAQNALPKIEHPQYTRPSNWRGYQVPELLLEGNHKKIQDWRLNWWK